MPALETLGWDDAWNVAFEPFRTEELEPGRVAVPHRGAYDVLTRDGEVRARVAGRLRMSVEPSGLPVVGDWVALGDKGEIVGVLPRRTVFSRRAPHEPDSESVREQVVAANVDVVFVTFPLGSDLDPLLLERYVTLALESGARPVILLTKADLEDEPDAPEDQRNSKPHFEDVRRAEPQVGSGVHVAISYIADLDPSDRSVNCHCEVALIDTDLGEGARP